MELVGNLLFVGGSFLVPVWLMTHHSSRSSLVGTSIQRIVFMSAHLIISYVWMAKVSNQKPESDLNNKLKDDVFLQVFLFFFSKFRFRYSSQTMFIFFYSKLSVVLLSTGGLTFALIKASCSRNVMMNLAPRWSSMHCFNF